MTPELMDVKSTIAELQTALLSAHPEMPILLRKIHTKLKADPAVVTLLDEDEIAQIITGLKEVTNVQFSGVKKPTSKKASADSRLKSLLSGSGISADDF